MDIHKVDSPDFSVEDVVKAHMQDLSVQDRFDVKQVKYWVNVKEKTIFCLMEGPDKDACNEVHLQSHGQTACNIIEVSDDQFSLLMGSGTKDEGDLAHRDNGDIDPGYRTFLSIHLNYFSEPIAELTTVIHRIIKEHNGLTYRTSECNQIHSIFTSASESTACALELRQYLNTHANAEHKIALVSGNPVEETDDAFFGKSLSMAGSICKIAPPASILSDSYTINLCASEGSSPDEQDSIQSINSSDAVLIDRVCCILDENLGDHNFKTSELARLSGSSNSKLYRKIKAAGDLSPKQLLQEFRLQHALSDIQFKDLSISEAAYRAGFSSPAYFTRQFKKRFNILPTEARG